VNVEKVGNDDSASFLKVKIPVITFHSLTQETWPILHSPRDQLSAIDHDRYYDAYHLVAVYLAYLDATLDVRAPQQ
jgi:Iap family predicted aminopeptidase